VSGSRRRAANADEWTQGMSEASEMPPAPDLKLARRMGEVAAEKGFDDVAAYLTGVADWLEAIAGSAIIADIRNGDEVRVTRKRTSALVVGQDTFDRPDAKERQS